MFLCLNKGDVYPMDSKSYAIVFGPPYKYARKHQIIGIVEHYMYFLKKTKTRMTTSISSKAFEKPQKAKE